MKLKLLLILCTALLSLNSLLAEPDTSASNEASDSSIHKNSASEWCLFLNEQDSSEGFYLSGSSYYDSSKFKSSIKQTWVKSGLFEGHYTYAVVANHGDDLIENLKNKDVQKKFDQWEKKRVDTEAKEIVDEKARKAAEEKEAAEDQARLEVFQKEIQKKIEEENDLIKKELLKKWGKVFGVKELGLEMPTRAELCDVLNDKLAALIDPSYLPKAQEIIERYPDTAISHFMPADALVDITETSNGGNKDCVGIGVSWKKDSDHTIFKSFPDVYDFAFGLESWDEATKYQFSVYDERPVWDQVDDFITAYRGVEVEDSTVEKDGQREKPVATTYRRASNKDLNCFLSYWGLRLSQENDPSLDLPVGMATHVVLIDPSSGEERQRWVMLIPLQDCSKLPKSHYIIPTHDEKTLEP